MMSRKLWDVKVLSVVEDKSEIDEALVDGWEPFAGTTLQETGLLSVERIWLRRQVEVANTHR